MQKYIAELKQFFALIKQNMNQQSKNPKISASSLAHLQQAQQAIADLEDKIIQKPYGVLWIDLAFHFLNCTQNCTSQSRNNLINLFMWANKKSPVCNARDIDTIDPMIKIYPGIIFYGHIHPNTLTTINPIKIPVKTINIAIQKAKINNTHKR